MRILLLLACILLASRSVSGLTRRDLASLDRILSEFITSASAPRVIRLSFHDCVGGCDGCINVENPDNAGLQPLVEWLETTYSENNLKSHISRADFWAYAGFYALNKVVENTNANCNDRSCFIPPLRWSFQYGRKDCATSPYTTEDVLLPGPHLTYQELTSFFSQRFGFNPDEAVAIMGVHTLGGVFPNNSGFNGTFVTGNNGQLTNKYYTDMLRAYWTQRNVGDRLYPRWQWMARQTGVRLNSDMSMVKDLQLNEHGESACKFERCRVSQGAVHVHRFSRNQSAWLNKFYATFNKMQANGCNNLRNVV